MLTKQKLSEFKGEWISVVCTVTYGEKGRIAFIENRISDNKNLIHVDVENVDTWRGTKLHHFVRPKWGIYRSLKDADNLRPGTEIVRFANFTISQLDLSQQMDIL